MTYFTVIALPAVACGVVWALFWLPSSKTGWLVRLDVGLAWFAALATLILVPTDVAAALAQRQPGPLAVWWRAAYWYGFAVQVLVLPLHMEYIRSGEFTAKDRLLAAARYNLLYYALLLAVGLAGLLLLLFSGRLKPANVVGFCIAFSNAYGLVAAIFLLGFGLVAVPRALWNSADRRGEQRRVWHKAGLQAEHAREAHRRLSAAVLTVRRASVLFAPHDPLRPLMDRLLSLADSVGPSFKPDSGVTVPDESELDVFDGADLARLRRELKAALQRWERENALYVEAVHEHLRLEQVVARTEAGLPERAPLMKRLRWLWDAHLHFWAFRLLAALAALCSLGMVVAEATMAWTLPNLSSVSAALHATAGAQFLTELLCFLFLAYPCACAYYSLYRLGRFAFYRMVPRHTDAYSLCYSALLMCRFAAPLAFNFMAAIAMPETKGHNVPDVSDTVFYHQFGQLMMRQPLIGWQFTTFAPALLVPYMLLLASGVFGHLMGLFKRGDALEFEDEWQNDSYSAAGRRLLLIESDNVRSGLPPGLTIEPGEGAAASDAGLSGGGRGNADVSAPGGSSARLLGTLRSAAAAAAAEEAATQRNGGGPWWRRLVPAGMVGNGSSSSSGRQGDDSDGGGENRVPLQSHGGRSRFGRLVGSAGGTAGGSADVAGYSLLPDQPVASLPVRAPSPTRLGQQQLGRAGSGAGGSSGSLFGGSPSLPGAATGGMKAARTKFLAGAMAPAVWQVQPKRQGSLDVEGADGNGGRGESNSS